MKILINFSTKCTMYYDFIIRQRLRWHSCYNLEQSNQKYEKGQSLPSDLKLMMNTSFASALFKTHLVMLIFEDTLVIVLNFGFWGAKTAADLMLPILLCCSCMWQLVIYKELFVYLWHPPSSVFKKMVLPNSPGRRSSCEASCYLWLFACLSQCFPGTFLN